MGNVAEGTEDSIGHAFDIAVQVGLPGSATGEGRCTVVLRFASFRRIIELSTARQTVSAPRVSCTSSEKLIQVDGLAAFAAAVAHLILAKLDSPSIRLDRTARIVTHRALWAVRLCPPRKK